MAREIVEKFICDRTGTVEIRKAGTTLDNMEEPQDDSADFTASLRCDDGSVVEIVFQDLCGQARRDVLDLLRQIEAPAEGDVVQPENAKPPAEEEKPAGGTRKTKRSRRTMAQLTKDRVAEHGLLEAFDSLSDKEREEYIRADKVARKNGEDPPHIDIKEEEEEEEEEEELVEEEENAPDPDPDEEEDDDEEEGDFF